MLEGKYWKRKLDAVATEYRKWRTYYREKNVSRHSLIPDPLPLESEMRQDLINTVAFVGIRCTFQS